MDAMLPNAPTPTSSTPQPGVANGMSNASTPTLSTGTQINRTDPIRRPSGARPTAGVKTVAEKAEPQAVYRVPSRTR